MLTRIKKLIRASYLGTCAVHVRANYSTRAKFLAGDIETDSGMAHAGRAVESSLAYIEEVFGDYKRYSGITRFTGKVAEVGPGDNCGVGLLFLADGCECADLVDRFYSKRKPEQNAEVYRALIERHPSLAARFGTTVSNDEDLIDGLRRSYGESASAEEYFGQATGYNFIVSRAVMEHVYDPILAIRKMARALGPGGMLLHKVDLRDHGMFSENFHELKFLEVPDWLYRMMTRDSGKPNRVLAHEYRSVLEEVLPEHTILITRLAGVGPIEPHVPYDDISESLKKKSVVYIRSVRHRFANSLRTVSDEDLSIAGIFVVARKTMPESAAAP